MEEIIFDLKSFNKIFREFLIIGYLKEKPISKDEILGELLEFYQYDSDVSLRTIERALKDIKKFWGINIKQNGKEKQNNMKTYIDFGKNEDIYKTIVELMLTYVFKDNLIKHSIDPIIRNIENPFLFFAKLYKAITKKKHITFDYYLETQDRLKKDMDLEPYDLVHKNGKWFLLGVSQKNPDDNVVKQYYVTNIKNLKINDELPSFKIKSNIYNRDEYYKYAWDVFIGKEIYEIKIWFSKNAGFRVLSFHEIQPENIIETDDGIILKIKSYSYYEIANWVLGFGKDAKILSPEECVQFIKNKLKETLELY